MSTRSQMLWRKLQAAVRGMEGDRIALFNVIRTWLIEVKAGEPREKWDASGIESLLVEDPAEYGNGNASITPEIMMLKIGTKEPKSVDSMLSISHQYLRNLLATRSTGPCPLCGGPEMAAVCSDKNALYFECDACAFICRPDMHTPKDNTDRVRLAKISDLS